MKLEPKQKKKKQNKTKQNQSNPFLSHVIGSGEEDRWRWRQSKSVDDGGVLRKTGDSEGRDQAPI